MEPEKPNIIGSIFFWLHAVLTVCALGIVVIMLFIGTLFFDDPNAIYEVFFLQMVGIATIIALPFLASVLFRIKGYAWWSSVVSALASAVMIGGIIFFVITYRIEAVLPQKEALTPSSTNFVCAQEHVAISLWENVQGTSTTPVTIAVEDQWENGTRTGTWVLGVIYPTSKVFITPDPRKGAFSQPLPQDVIDYESMCLNSEGKTLSSISTTEKWTPPVIDMHAMFGK